LISFAPLLPLPLLAAAGIASLLAIIIALAVGARGAVWRIPGFALLFFILCGPSYVVQTRHGLPDIAVAVLDQSQSMSIGNRAAMAAAALKKLQTDAVKIPNLEFRVVDVPAAADGGTPLFGALRDGLADIPAAQLAGVVAITDGELSDAPKQLGLQAPLTALLTAAGEETDRELRLNNAPAYGLVGQNVQLGFTIIDHGASDDGSLAAVTVSANGSAIWSQNVPVGAPVSVAVPVRHAGAAIISVQAAPLPGEVSTVNNQAAFTLNGVRKRLEVLLISGDPNQGERSWRVLLKSDPAVELVHFTILRTPGEIMDALPNELALVPFPVQQLFDDDIGRFDLIILDQFNASGLLPPQYLANIANRVEDGGALLVEVGPEFATDASLAYTPLAPVLPAVPSTPGTVTQAFTPGITALGARHPVTARFAGKVLAPWYRQEIVTPTTGDVLMQGVNNAPLLILSKSGKGRVGMLLSDQFWLWTRGGGETGPALPLLRRCVHWLLNEPALEAEALTATIEDGQITVQRQTLSETYPGDATITTPAGQSLSLKLRQSAPGNYAARIPADQPGVWQVHEGGLAADAALPAQNALEYQDLAATSEWLKPLASNLVWLGKDPAPALAPMLRRRYASVVTGTRDVPLLPPLPSMLAVLVLLAAAWWRERG
jgi:hypothetical protein